MTKCKPKWNFFKWLEQQEKTMAYRSTYPRSYAVINRDAAGYLVVAMIEARGQIEAVNKRHEAMGRPEPGRIVAVSRGLPGDYGTGATRLYPVTYVPPVPVTPQIRIGAQPIKADDFDDLL